ncbi:MAG: reverse transcriptase-like protein [Nitrospirae bacterium]|nr:MAG: reverse transcriptase-like protein [Nitrospirota bacterium]
MTRKAVLYTDGASSGNPGPAGIGYVLIFDGQRISHSAFIGETTNNVAEYTALLRGLETAIKKGVEEIEVFMDSELVVRQINGQYRVKEPHLQRIYKKVIDVLRNFKRYEIKHIPRTENKEADRLSREAIKRGRRTHP